MSFLNFSIEGIFLKSVNWTFDKKMLKGAHTSDGHGNLETESDHRADAVKTETLTELHFLQHILFTQNIFKSNMW